MKYGLLRLMQCGVVQSGLLQCGLVVAGVSAAFPQAVSVGLSATPPPPSPSTVAMWAGMSGFVPSNIVTGQPYSARQETETVQTLADGTHITNGIQKIFLYRDSAGRTRTERVATPPPGLPASSTPPPVFIEVVDPVSEVRYSFDSTSQRGYRYPFATRAAKRLSALIPPPPPGPPAEPVKVVPVQRIAAPRPEITRDQLGTQSIEGVLAEGVRTTTTYPVGLLGNDRPLVTFTEVWTSRDLGIAVLTKTSDPRSGETTIKLLNISRAEPDASLFRPPSGYEIVDPADGSKR